MLSAALCLLLLLTGCARRRNTEKYQIQALEYYRTKYSVEDVTVISAYKDGYYEGLFGYVDLKDMAYELSDGNTVYYRASEGSFADNAQGKTIVAAFQREVLKPLLSDFSFPVKYTAFDLYLPSFVSFEDCVFTTYYDGDIKSFLQKESPSLLISIALETEDVEAGEQEITRFYEALREDVSGRSEISILQSGLRELRGDDWHVDERSLNVTAKAYLDFDEGIQWYRQAYIEIYDGIFVSSKKLDFVFEDGDVWLEEAGTCVQIQEEMDRQYFSLPVDAAENKDGAYLREDQRHESRYVLDDPDAPCYRLRLSQRVLDVLDKQNGIAVYFLDRRSDGAPLLVNRGNRTVYPILSDGTEQVSYASLGPDYLYCFGTYHTVPYGGSGAAGEEAQDKNG